MSADWEHDGRPRWHFNEWHGLAATLLVMLTFALLISCDERQVDKAVWHPAPGASATEGR